MDPSLDIESLGALCLGTIDKTLFSMLTPEVVDHIGPNPPAFVIMGIEVSASTHRLNWSYISPVAHLRVTDGDGLKKTLFQQHNLCPR